VTSEGQEVALGEMASDRLCAEYGAIVTEILRRLNGISESLAKLCANPQHPDNWKNCDFSWLQMRKICEYLAVGIVFAHHLENGGIDDLTKWRPKELLAQAKALSEHPAPMPIAPLPIAQPNGERQIVPLAQPIEAKVISEIYGRCGDVLHLGSVDRILKENLPAYDVPQMEMWVAGLRKLMENHVLLLPGVRTILLCHTQKGRTDTVLMVSDGAILNAGHLPKFGFEAA
jgi:hypothetical protein